MRKMRNACKILVDKAEGKGTRERPSAGTSAV